MIFCGTDSTSEFAGVHEESYLDMIANLFVGTLDDDTSRGTEDGCTGGEGNTIAENPLPLSPASANAPRTIGLEELRVHDLPEDCWTIYFGKVYDITGFAPTHPVAGPDVIWEFCGADGTRAYSIYHKPSLLSMVEAYYVGPFGRSNDHNDETNAFMTPSVTEQREMTSLEVELHNHTTDCWTIMYGNVYELTYYRHPGAPPAYGQRVIFEYSCGKDSTRDYASVHPRDMLNKARMDRYKVGWVSSARHHAALALVSVGLGIGLTLLNVA